MHIYSSFINSFSVQYRLWSQVVPLELLWTNKMDLIQDSLRLGCRLKCEVNTRMYYSFNSVALHCPRKGYKQHLDQMIFYIRFNFFSLCSFKVRLKKSDKIIPVTQNRPHFDREKRCGWEREGVVGGRGVREGSGKLSLTTYKLLLLLYFLAPAHRCLLQVSHMWLDQASVKSSLKYRWMAWRYESSFMLSW